MTKGVKNGILGCMKKICLILSVLFLASGCFAKGTKDKNKLYQIAPNTYMSKLDNGLTVFISENHSVPLAYIEVAVRAGAITQTKENAGLFHLYEHMMFKGNSLYKNSAAVQKALSDMGTASWNGSTGIECVNYYFTVPKKQLRKGLEFWNAAIREPLMDKGEFEVEKKVVISEISGQYSNPDRIIGRYINENLYCDAPWQLDPGGSVENVKNATLENLIEIKNKFYIPENAAVFVGGDVDVNEVLKMVTEVYGDWSNNGVELSQIEECVMTQTKTPFEKSKCVIIPYDKISPQIMQVNFLFRGPDSDLEPQETCAADLLHCYLNDPESPYIKQFLDDSLLMIPNSDYIGSSYSTRRRTGIINFNFVMVNPQEDFIRRINELFKQNNQFLFLLAKDKNIVPKTNRKKIIQRLKDDGVYESETSSGLLAGLRYNWITNDIDYYKNYMKNISNVTNADLKNYMEKYIVDKAPLVLIYINTQVYEQLKNELKDFEYEEFKY